MMTHQSPDSIDVIWDTEETNETMKREKFGETENIQGNQIIQEKVSKMF